MRTEDQSDSLHVIEKGLIELLDSFKPAPSDSFYAHMRKAPWIRATPSRSFHRYKNQPIFYFAGLTLLVLVLITGVLLSPSVQVTARQLMLHFIPESEDHLVVQLPVPGLGEPVEATSREAYNLKLTEAEALAGFKLRRFSAPPEDLSLVGARYDGSLHAVTLLYEGDHLRLYFVQRKIDHVQEYFSIGASATVEPVELRGNVGEFVAGGWKVNTSNQKEDNTSQTQKTLDISWDPDLPQATLRWQEDDTAFELRANGIKIPSKDKLIQIANSLE